MCWACLQPEHYSSLDGSFADPAAAIRYVSTYRALLAYRDGRDTARWNNEMAPGTPVIVTYSFTETADLPDPDDSYYDISGYRSFTAEQRADFRAAAQVLQETAGVILVEKTGEAMISVLNADGSDWAGWAHYPSSTGDYTFAGHLVMSYRAGTSYAPGTYAFETILHELGHAMGLKHPFEGGIRLLDSLDVKSRTLMSYDYDGRNFSIYSPLDVLALRHLYGGPADTEGWSWHYRKEVLVVKGGGKADVILGVMGGNDLDGRGGADRLVGREAADTLRGGDGDDRLAGRGGADMLLGGRGNDTLHGNLDRDPSYDWAADRLKGGAGNDALFGQSGDDSLSGDNGHDLLNGQDGQDRLLGGNGADTLQGGYGQDTLLGGGGNDLLVGDVTGFDHDLDLLEGGAGNDTLRSWIGDDTLRGGGGDDRIEVRGGRATAEGNGGADVFVIRGTGSATLRGGGGDDSFLLHGAQHMLRIDTRQDRGIDRIHGFDLDTDSLTLTGPGKVSFHAYGGGKLKLIAGAAELRFADVSYADREDLLIYS